VSGLWVVTGASRGIGRAVAMELGAPGRPLIVTATALPQLAAVGAALKVQGCVATPLALDLSLPGAVAALEAALQGQEVAGLVNNAGVLVRERLERLTDADIDRVLSINLAGLMRVTRACLERMKPGARVINIGSISGTVGTAEASLYNATKWALTGLTRSWAEEWRGRGIVVAEVRPGAVETDMLRQTPYPAQMQPQDVARAVRFLALEAPAAVTGTSLDLFG
jgi:3-oxoacyl-[acyl-carrier protein] reductase